MTEFGFAYDVGHRRDLNEDSAVVHPGLGLWLVADGVGGQACGEVASAMTAYLITHHIAHESSLKEAIQHAHESIGANAKINNNTMASTVVALKEYAHHYQIAWVGDSRAYLWEPRTQTLTQLSRDHSYVQQLIDEKLIQPEQALRHPYRHVLNQALGNDESIHIDTLERPYNGQQKILLCSDGLSNTLSHAEIIDTLTRYTHAQHQADALLAAALNKTADDNITLIIIDLPVHHLKQHKPHSLFKRFFSTLTGS